MSNKTEYKENRAHDVGKNVGRKGGRAYRCQIPGCVSTGREAENQQPAQEAIEPVCFVAAAGGGTPGDLAKKKKNSERHRKR